MQIKKVFGSIFIGLVFFCLGCVPSASDDTTDIPISDTNMSSTESPLPVIVRTDPTIDDTNCTENESCNICPAGVECQKLGGSCIKCDFLVNCTYGADTRVKCRVQDSIQCTGDREFGRSYKCGFCYQTHKWEHTCLIDHDCRVTDAPRSYTVSNCTVKDNILCMGRRRFHKKRLCNWTKGYRWSTALILSITLGGFGADRFYLGLWGDGIGKLFSFGGLGVWTLVDVILIATGYVGPGNGSLYIY